MYMVEVQQVHLVLAIPLLHMSLLEGQQLEVEVAVAEIPLLLIGQGIETEEVKLMGMVMDKVAQEVDKEMAMVMAMEMEMEMVKKTVRVKLLVIEDLLDHKALQVFKAQQVYKVFKVYKDPLDPKDYRVYLALMVGKAFKEIMDLLENEALKASMDKEVLQFTYQELLHQIWSTLM